MEFPFKSLDSINAVCAGLQEKIAEISLLEESKQSRFVYGVSDYFHEDITELPTQVVQE